MSGIVHMSTLFFCAVHDVLVMVQNSRQYLWHMGISCRFLLLLLLILVTFWSSRNESSYVQVLSSSGMDLDQHVCSSHKKNCFVAVLTFSEHFSCFTFLLLNISYYCPISCISFVIGEYSATFWTVCVLWICDSISIQLFNPLKRLECHFFPNLWFLFSFT